MREMKDSGIEWIGEIPTDWETRKIKQLADSNIENSFVDGDWIESPYIVDCGIRYLTTGNIGDGVFKEQGNGYITLKTFEELACKYAFPGDLIISRLNAPYGRSCILPSDYTEYVVAVDNVILRTQEDKRYICYVSQCDGYKYTVEDDAKGTTMKRISRTNLGNIVMPLPPIQQQHRIADYLDRKCSQIDAIIARQQEVIEKLKAYKLSVITEAVTKGLKPDVPMKDSGVEWIGEIPGNWKLSHIGNLVEMGSGGTPDRKKPEYWENGNISWMSSGEINDEYIYSTAEQITELGHQNSNTRILPINTVMLGLIGQGKTKGLAAILKTEVCCNQNLAYLIADEKYLHYRYLFYCFKAMYFYMRGLVGESQAGIYSSFLKKLHIPLPDIEQQIRISDYLDKKCETIKNSIDKREHIIAKLTRYQKSLIYEVVTGKKEV